MLKALVRRMVTMTPRLYADAAVSHGEDYTNSEKVTINWGHQDDYEIIDKLGQGKYSEVYKGVNLITLEQVVIKILKPIKVERILREVKILGLVGGKNNTALLKEVVKDYATQVPSLILEYVSNLEPKTQLKNLNDFEIRYYLYEIAKALDYCHSLGIIHRDVKRGNIMIDHKKRRCRLIDWGLAEFYKPETKLSVKVSSKPYKAPELLVYYDHYDYSLDSWCLGVTMAGLIFQKDPFFYGEDNDKVLLNIINTLGTDEFFDYLSKFQIPIDGKLERMIEKANKKPWSRFITQENKHLVSEDAFNLLDKVLTYNHYFRLLPKEIMSHSYFEPVREMWALIDSGRDIPTDKVYSVTAEIIKSQSSSNSS